MNYVPRDAYQLHVACAQPFAPTSVVARLETWEGVRAVVVDDVAWRAPTVEVAQEAGAWADLASSSGNSAEARALLRAADDAAASHASVLVSVSPALTRVTGTDAVAGDMQSSPHQTDILSIRNWAEGTMLAKVQDRARSECAATSIKLGEALGERVELVVKPAIAAACVMALVAQQPEVISTRQRAEFRLLNDLSQWVLESGQTEVSAPRSSRLRWW